MGPPISSRGRSRGLLRDLRFHSFDPTSELSAFTSSVYGTLHKLIPLLHQLPLVSASSTRLRLPLLLASYTVDVLERAAYSIDERILQLRGPALWMTGGAKPLPHRLESFFKSCVRSSSYFGYFFCLRVSLFGRTRPRLWDHLLSLCSVCRSGLFPKLLSLRLFWGLGHCIFVRWCRFFRCHFTCGGYSELLRTRFCCTGLVR